jgi:DNA-directed RNA polymerase I subunit RPA2
MEDAMVINKASYQRGFAHGTVIKVERLNLVEKSGGGGGGRFGRATTCDEIFFGGSDETHPESVGPDGLPIQGRLYHNGEYYYT